MPHNDPVPPPAPDAPIDVPAYYAAVSQTLLHHIGSRAVIGMGRSSNHVPGRSEAVLHLTDQADLAEAVRSGVVAFRLPGLTGSDMVTLHVRSGDGTGIDTVATTALALVQLMIGDGVRSWVMSDGSDGLYLVGSGGNTDSARHYARQLADTSPEIATTDAADSGGRALIEPLTAGAVTLPAPYSLVFERGRAGVVAPITADEVAAASAGMPLEIEPAEIAHRITSLGDPAAALGLVTRHSA